jgi:hypothetical protein
MRQVISPIRFFVRGIRKPRLELFSRLKSRAYARALISTCPRDTANEKRRDWLNGANLVSTVGVDSKRPSSRRGCVIISPAEAWWQTH